jgi:hypothetical protein
MLDIRSDDPRIRAEAFWTLRCVRGMPCLYIYTRSVTALPHRPNRFRLRKWGNLDCERKMYPFLFEQVARVMSRVFRMSNTIFLPLRLASSGLVLALYRLSPSYHYSVFDIVAYLPLVYLHIVHAQDIAKVHFTSSTLSSVRAARRPRMRTLFANHSLRITQGVMLHNPANRRMHSRHRAI